jgi:hypothetical protein
MLSTALRATAVTAARSSPRSAAALGGGGDIVADPHLGGLDVVEVGLFAGHVEVEVVAAVVAEQAEHAGAAVAGLDHVGHLLGGGGGEHIADGASVQEALAHVAEEDRQVAAPAAGDDRHLALPGRRIAQDDAIVPVQRAQTVAVCQDDAFDHFVHETFRRVHDLLHGHSLSNRDLCQILPHPGERLGVS